LLGPVELIGTTPDGDQSRWASGRRLLVMLACVGNPLTHQEALAAALGNSKPSTMGRTTESYLGEEIRNGRLALRNRLGAEHNKLIQAGGRTTKVDPRLLERSDLGELRAAAATGEWRTVAELLQRSGTPLEDVNDFSAHELGDAVPRWRAQLTAELEGYRQRVAEAGVEPVSEPNNQPAPPSASQPDTPSPTSRRRALRPAWPAIAASAVTVSIIALGLTVAALSGRDDPAGRTTTATVAEEVQGVLRRALRLRTGFAVKSAPPSVGSVRTWQDYRIAGGEAGPIIEADTPVMVTCRVRGYKVESGNEWWYLIASSPWEKQYFATADGFWNRSKTTGNFRSTPLVDRRVPECP